MVRRPLGLQDARALLLEGCHDESANLWRGHADVAVPTRLQRLGPHRVQGPFESKDEACHPWRHDADGILWHVEGARVVSLAVLAVEAWPVWQTRIELPISKMGGVSCSQQGQQGTAECKLFMANGMRHACLLAACRHTRTHTHCPNFTFARLLHL
jgi:hypothetical protein